MISQRWITLPALGALFALAAIGTAVFPARASSRHASQPTPIALTGAEWVRFGPDEREAYLAGFIAGAAAHQATGARAVSGARVAAEAARLKQTSALAFPFATNVYRSHLDDYFFYENRRRETLIEAIVELNGSLRGGRE